RHPEVFTVHLRIPGWAKSHEMFVNGKPADIAVQHGWLAIRRRWRAGDEVTLRMPMEIERVAMPRRFIEYDNLIALRRGPIVYCLEEQDLEGASRATGFSAVATVYLPEEAQLTAEHRPDFLGGVTVIRGAVTSVHQDDGETTLPATFVPYCVWGNRG